MKTNDTIDDDTTATLAAIVRLLRHGAVCAWAQAEAEGPRSRQHLLGLGIHIAYCQALAMLPPDVHLNGNPPVQDEVAQLLRAAEQLTRSISVVDQRAGISPLFVAICDLVRETTP